MSSLQELTVAVLGLRGAGKSAFVKIVRDLDDPFSMSFTGKQASIDNLAFYLRFIEVNLEDMRGFAECPMNWPSFVQKDDLRVDGAFVLWDVHQRIFQDEISKTLGRLTTPPSSGRP